MQNARLVVVEEEVSRTTSIWRCVQSIFREIGRSLREGQTPATFKDFLGTDPFTKRYSQLPQFERGVTQTMTNPRTRFIFY